MIRLLKVAVFLTLCGFVQSALADKSSALNWLSSQNQQTGEISLASDLATADQSTAEAILALSAWQSVDVDLIISEGIQFLTSFDLSKSSTERISRLIRIRALRGENFDNELSNLLLRMSQSGGFSDYPGDSPTVLSTSFALQALADVNYPIDQEIIGFLLNTQQPSGAWAFPAMGDSSVVLTAYAMSALWRYRGQFVIDSYLDAAQGYLESQKDFSTQLWSNPEASALVLRALAQKLVDRTSIISSVQALLYQQLSNGSFDNDVYVTSLVAQLLQTLEKPALDAIEVSGTVVDADSGVALSGVAIKLEGAESFETNTNIEGNFAISPNSEGQYVLTVSLGGYSQLVLNTSLVTGNQLSIGEIALNKLAIDPDTGEPIVTGTVRGTIKSRVTNAPLQGVGVSINGQADLTTVTDSDGEYQISNVPPGNISVSAVLGGFQAATETAELLERQTFIFSPRLAKALSSNVSLTGIVTDNDSGQPLAGALIVANQNGSNFQVATAVDGRYVLSDLPQGVLEISASLDGYVAVQGSVDAPPGANLSFSPSLVQEGSLPADDKASIKGTIIDIETGRGLEGVALALTYAFSGQTLTFNSDADGNVDIPNLDSGVVFLEISLAGYRTLSATFELQSGLGFDLATVELEPEVLQETADVSGRLVDVRTNQSISNGIVSVSRNDGLTIEVMSDANGLFTANMVDLGDVTFSISAQGYVTNEFATNVGIPGDIDLGDIRLRPEGVDDLLPDLAIKSIDTTQVYSNQSTFEVGGTIAIEIANYGNASTVSGQKVIVYDDVNNNDSFDEGDIVLAEGTIDEGLHINESYTYRVNIGGVQRFRDAPLSVFVDASNILAELDETNNVQKTELKAIAQESRIVNLNARQHALNTRTGTYSPLLVDLSVGTWMVYPIIDEYIAWQPWGRRGRYYHSFNVNHDGESIVSAGSIVSSSALTSLYNSKARDGSRVFEIAEGGTVEAYISDSQISDNASGVSLQFFNKCIAPYGLYEFGGEVDAELVEAAKLFDLTIGQIALTNVGGQIQISAVVGNAGSYGLNESIILKFFDGDPARGGIALGTVVHADGLMPSEYEVVAMDPISPQNLVTGEVFAKVELVNDFHECKTVNNSTSRVLKSPDGEIELGLDKSQYHTGESAQFASTVINTGLLFGEYKVDTIIKDSSGNEVVRFSNQATGSIEPNDEVELSGSWLVAQSLAGTYMAESLLYNSAGELIDQDQESFIIVSDSQVTASIRTTTDRAQYNTTDQVEISNLVRNLSTNSIQSNAQLLVTINDPSGIEVYQNISALDDLAPSFSVPYTELFQLNNADLGNYVVTGMILDEDGLILATDSTEFSVGLVLDVAITGDVSVSTERVFQSEMLQCFDQVLNTTMTDIDDLQLRQLVVAVDLEQVVLTNESTNALAGNSNFNLSRDVDTSGYELGNYACALQVFVDGDWVTLDSEFFEVLEPPIKITLGINIGGKGSVLILLDDDQSYSTSGSEPDLSQQRTYLENLLTQAGWNYTIVTSGDAFVQELQTGQHINYLLLSEAEKISEQGQKELREAVYRGEGLVEAGSHDQRQGRIDDALGVKFKGKSNTVQGISLFDSDIAVADNLILSVPDSVLTAELEGATKVAEYVPDLAKGNKPAPPATTVFEYGQGQSVYFGFDVLAEATLLNTYGSVFDQLILNSLNHINNLAMLAQPGAVKTVRITVNNEQQAAPARLTLTLPSDVTVHNAPDGTVSDDSVIWFLDLDEGDVEVVELWVSQSGRESILTALVESGEEPQWVVQHEASITLVQDEEISLSAVLDSISPDKSWKQVRKTLERARTYMDSGNLSNALRELLKASDRIEQFELPDSEAVRVNIAQLIRQTEQRLGGL